MLNSRIGEGLRSHRSLGRAWQPGFPSPRSRQGISRREVGLGLGGLPPTRPWPFRLGCSRQRFRRFLGPCRGLLDRSLSRPLTASLVASCPMGCEGQLACRTPRRPGKTCWPIDLWSSAERAFLASVSKICDFSSRLRLVAIAHFLGRRERPSARQTPARPVLWRHPAGRKCRLDRSGAQASWSNFLAVGCIWPDCPRQPTRSYRPRGPSGGLLLRRFVGTESRDGCRAGWRGGVLASGCRPAADFARSPRTPFPDRSACPRRRFLAGGRASLSGTIARSWLNRFLSFRELRTQLAPRRLDLRPDSGFYGHGLLERLVHPAAEGARCWPGGIRNWWPLLGNLTFDRRVENAREMRSSSGHEYQGALGRRFLAVPDHGDNQHCRAATAARIATASPNMAVVCWPLRRCAAP